MYEPFSYFQLALDLLTALRTEISSRRFSYIIFGVDVLTSFLIIKDGVLSEFLRKASVFFLHLRDNILRTERPALCQLEKTEKAGRISRMLIIPKCFY